MKRRNVLLTTILASSLVAMCLTGCGANSAASQAESALEEVAETTEVDSTSDEVTAQDEAVETEEVKQEEREPVVVPELEGYTLLWNDEFEGDALDESIWNYEPHEPGWTNNELQEYTVGTENVTVRDGALVIKANKTEKDGQDYYTSGKITSQNKKDFLYGKVVTRAKVPEGKGLWPAIWMMPTDESYYGQWPKCGEIDIMEVLGDQLDIAYSTIHYGEPHAEQQGKKVLTDGNFADGYHDYSVEWEPGEIRFYIDEEEVLVVNDWFSAVSGEDDKPYPAPFDQTFFVQMNLAVGGNWPGNPDETTNFDTAEFMIDYVRVYQKPEYDTNVQKPEKVFREPQEDGNMIYNGDFKVAEDLSDESDWTFLLFNGGEGSATIEDETMIIKTQEKGTEEYSVQLVQPDLAMYKGSKYKLTFEARSTEERPMVVCVSAPTAGWIRYLPDTRVGLTEEWQTFTYEFEMKEKDDNNGRLEFNMGKKKSTADIYIKNVRLEKVDG